MWDEIIVKCKDVTTGKSGERYWISAKFPDSGRVHTVYGSTFNFCVDRMHKVLEKETGCYTVNGSFNRKVVWEELTKALVNFGVEMDVQPNDYITLKKISNLKKISKECE